MVGACELTAVCSVGMVCGSGCAVCGFSVGIVASELTAVGGFGVAIVVGSRAPVGMLGGCEFTAVGWLLGGMVGPPALPVVTSAGQVHSIFSHLFL